jgi:hypothetical protein
VRGGGASALAAEGEDGRSEGRPASGAVSKDGVGA